MRVGHIMSTSLYSWYMCMVPALRASARTCTSDEPIPSYERSDLGATS